MSSAAVVIGALRVKMSQYLGCIIIEKQILMLSTLDKIFSRQQFEILFLFFPDCSLETICMKCQILFSVCHQFVVC